MKTNKSSINIVEKAMLVILGERPIQDTTVQRMFNRCVGRNTAQGHRKVASGQVKASAVKSVKRG